MATPATPEPAPINVHDAKTQFSKLLARVEDGEEIVIARAGRPVARLVPVVRPSLESFFGCMKGQFTLPSDEVLFGPDPENEALWGYR